MINMLQQLPPIFQMLIVSLVSITGSYAVLKVIQLVYKGITIKFGKLLTINTELPNKQPSQVKPLEIESSDIPRLAVQRACPNWDSLANIFVELTDIIYKKAEVLDKIHTMKEELAKTDIKNPELLRDQMDYADRKCNHLIGICQKAYLKELEARQVDSVTKSNSYAIYRLILVGVVRREVEAIFRCYFKKTRLLSASDTEFRHEKTEQISLILQVITDTLNEEYFYETDIKREELYALNGKFVSKIKDEFEDALDEGRKLVKEKYKLFADNLLEAEKNLKKYNEELVILTAR